MALHAEPINPLRHFDILNVCRHLGPEALFHIRLLQKASKEQHDDGDIREFIDKYCYDAFDRILNDPTSLIVHLDKRHNELSKRHREAQDEIVIAHHYFGDSALGRPTHRVYLGIKSSQAWINAARKRQEEQQQRQQQWRAGPSDHHDYWSRSVEYMVKKYPHELHHKVKRARMGSIVPYLTNGGKELT